MLSSKEKLPQKEDFTKNDFSISKKLMSRHCRVAVTSLLKRQLQLNF